MGDNEPLVGIAPPPLAFLANVAEPESVEDSRECIECHEVTDEPLHVHYDVGGAQRRHLSCCDTRGCPTEEAHQKCGHVIAQRELMARA